ncbi:MAG: site-specific DNA-methyltransferase [Prolixibacteraceae bacterium]
MPTLHWIGKDKVINHHLDVPFKVLDHSYGFDNGTQTENETQSGNKIIHGDNLEALKSLLPEYEGRIKCIYIDPPYNTGNEGWAYNDNVNDPKIKKWLGLVVGKEAEDLTRHDKWLCMMYPRLMLLNRLLSEDGAIFISIDKNEEANLKLICDEIFGASNFIANVAVVNNLKGRSDDKYIATAHESLIIFQKGKFVTNGVPVPEEYQDEYKEHDDKGKYRLLGLRKRGSNAREVDRPNLCYPIYYNEKDDLIFLDKADDLVEILPKLSNGENGTWRWGKETLISRKDEIEVRKVRRRNEFDVFQKDYLSKDGENKTIKPKSFWLGTEFSSEAGTLQLKKIFEAKSFQTPKSVDFIHFILHQATNINSIVLDSFAGSGTTAHAVLNLNKQDGGNRKFILIEMEDYAETITAERVKRVINGYADKEDTDGSFDYYELGQALFQEDGSMNESVGIEKIRSYIWYTETKTNLTTVISEGAEVMEHASFLGKHNDTAYYFFYESSAITTLNHDYLAQLKTKAEQYVVFADNCLLTKSFMQKHHITFKKIPRDITRF